MRIAIIGLIVIGICVGIGRAQDDAAKKSLTAIKGAWKIKTFEVNGSPAKADAQTWTFEGDKMVAKGERDSAPPYKVSVDPSKRPAEITLTEKYGEGVVRPGIYEQDGDTLKIYFAEPDAVRPKNFGEKAPDGKVRYYLVFTREKK